MTQVNYGWTIINTVLGICIGQLFGIPAMIFAILISGLIIMPAVEQEDIWGFRSK